MAARFPLVRLALLWLAASLLTGCGFHLRGNLPLSQYPAIYVQSEAHSELATLLKQRFLQNKVELISSYQADKPALTLVRDTLERRTLSLFANGQVAEYELIYKVEYLIQLVGQEPQRYQFELYRDYQDDPNQALAKAQELELLLSELRQQAANRIIRQLARLG
ncbi:LPS-assembly lipoprotein LptE [Alishewanella longhuensis]|uniref:LPS-assembly lipoprotein LptE n=1 Tax=Alishewanella longhuensis TaxID=1091037 RepID=A0ABQ3KZX8_9ALTE|nr:LPS assembly lipoprotein LptE [Alishewanella longhuensis]GHG73463.1 LPS-assembly lipoprotein LptE [Alishewanella longhuensis]